MADNLIRNQVYPQGVRRWVPRRVAATLPQSGIRYQGVGAAAPRLLITACCLLPAVCCYAEELPDPTRPPAMIFVPDGAPLQGATESRWSSGLQTIIISESRRAAIIDGRTVELGAKHGNARLVEVNEGSVMLQGARGKKVLNLFPDVKIRKKDMPNKETGAEQPSSTSKAQSEEPTTNPAAHYENLLSGHPKEKK